MTDKASRPAPTGKRVPGMSGHEAHSHSPQRLPPIASRSKQLSANASYMKVLDSQEYSGFRQGPSNKSFGLGEHQNQSSEHRIIGRALVQEDDPFVSSRQSPAAIQQWRSMLRSTSHDVSMPDYTSSKSAVNTEMSGVIDSRGNFERQVNEANPEEIVDALSPLRREQLLQVLSASTSPASGMGTRPPVNTPLTVVEASNDDVINQASWSVGVAVNTETKLWHEPRQRPRTSSESTSARSTSAPSAGHSKGSDSHQKPRETSVPIPKSHLLPVAPRSQSLNVGRQRSDSTSSKRKRRSASPSIDIAQEDTIRVVIATPTTSATDNE